MNSFQFLSKNCVLFRRKENYGMHRNCSEHNKRKKLTAKWSFRRVRVLCVATDTCMRRIQNECLHEHTEQVRWEGIFYLIQWRTNVLWPHSSCGWTINVFTNEFDTTHTGICETRDSRPCVHACMLRVFQYSCVVLFGFSLSVFAVASCNCFRSI